MSGLGTAAIALGGFGLVCCPLLPLLHHEVDGTLPAISLVVALLGFALRFPTLLQDGSTDSNNQGNVSTMRLSVLGLIVTFLLVTVKAGWDTPKLADLRIDPSWAWILAATLGGKAAQSFAELKSSK